MTIIAAFDLRGDLLPLTGPAAAAPAVTVELDRVMAADPANPVLVFWVSGEGIGEFERALAETGSVAGITTLDTIEQARLYRVRFGEPVPSLYAEFIAAGTAPVSATVTGAGWHVQTRFVDREALARFREACREVDIDFRLRELYRGSASPDRNGAFGLTGEQREALALAHERGYFAVPRRTSLAALGDELGIAPTSVSERLRRAQDRLIAAARRKWHKDPY